MLARSRIAQCSRYQDVPCSPLRSRRGREELNLKSYDDDYVAKIDAIPESPEGMRGGVHRELVKLQIETAQDAIRTWLACQREDGLEEIVAHDVTEEYRSELKGFEWSYCSQYSG